MKQNQKLDVALVQISISVLFCFYVCSILASIFFLFYFYFFLFNFYFEISGRVLRQEIYLRQTGPEQKYKQNSEKIEIKQEENRNKIGKNRNNIGQKQKVALSTGSLLVPFSSYFLRILHPISIFWYLLILNITQTQIGIQPHKFRVQGVRFEGFGFSKFRVQGLRPGCSGQGLGFPFQFQGPHHCSVKGVWAVLLGCSTVNPRKLEHGFWMIHTGIPYTSP